MSKNLNSINKFNSPSKVAVIGVGLIGGSIALSLKKHFGKKIIIHGSCQNLQRLKKAARAGIVDKILDLDKSFPKDIGLVVIATPVMTSINIAEELIDKIKHPCLIIDVGSTKEAVCRKMEETLPPHLSFVGTHPMAGGKGRGFENAKDNLFQNKAWVVCKTKKTNERDLALVKQLIRILKAKAIVIDAKAHDERVVWASHVFLTVGSILINVVVRQKDWSRIAEIASAGFYDTTRSSSFDPNIKTEIILTNRKNILKALDEIQKEIDVLGRILKKKQNEKLLSYFDKSKKARDKWVNNYHATVRGSYRERA